MKNNAPVGFFDSGVGGLSVYSRFRDLLPYENTIYYGDLKNLPYGNKTKEELIGFATNILNFFKTKNVKAVVIACNTSSALAYEAIKDKYDFKIYPIIQSCANIIGKRGYKRVGVFATVATVNSNAYKKELNKISPSMQINEIACPNWVPIVEGVLKNGDSDIKTHLEEMEQFNPEKIILGCTHYPYLLEKILKFAPQNNFIDPAEIFVDYIKSDLEKNNTCITGNEEFYVSANPEAFIKNAKLFYEVKTRPQIIDFNVK